MTYIIYILCNVHMSEKRMIYWWKLISDCNSQSNETMWREILNDSIVVHITGDENVTNIWINEWKTNEHEHDCEKRSYFPVCQWWQKTRP